VLAETVFTQSFYCSERKRASAFVIVALRVKTSKAKSNSSLHLHLTKLISNVSWEMQLIISLHVLSLGFSSN